MIHYLSQLQEDSEYIGTRYIGDCADNFQICPQACGDEKVPVENSIRNDEDGIGEAIPHCEDDLEIRAMFFLTIVCERIKRLNATAAKIHKKKAKKKKN